MPYINVNDVYIMDNTGKQVDDAVDYALANSNRNLLDNPWFTVNQRNITSITVGTAKTYTLDRWYAFRAKITALSGGGITFAWNGTDLTNGLLSQGSAYDLRNKTLTMSAIINGTLYSWTAAFTGTAISKSFSNISVRFQLDQAGTNTYAQIFVETATPVTISAVKLEIGSYSTLVNDVPPDYEDELRKCKYYYRELKAITATYLAQGVSVAGTNFRVILPYTMRTRPTVTYSGTLTAYYSGGNAPVTAISVAGTISDGVQLSLTTSGISGANQPVSLDAAAGAKICLSADL